MPSTILDTSIAELVFPTTFNTVAGQSIIVAIIVSIGNAATGYPIMLNIIISDIVPPPIGTAVTNNVATNETNNICIVPPNVAIFVPNKQTKNITLNTDPIILPSLCKFVPSGIDVSAISLDIPMLLVASIFTGIEAALEHVASAVTVGGIAFFQNILTPFSYLQ